MTTLNKRPSKHEETVYLTSNDEENEFNLACAIQRMSSWIHKWTLRGGGQFIIVEGKLAADLVKKIKGYADRTLNNRYQVVFIDNGVYKNCVTVVRRGEYARFVLKKAKKIDTGDFPDVSIPEIVIAPVNTRRADMVGIIHLERNADEQHVQDNSVKSVA
jgi:hypothetical protein